MTVTLQTRHSSSVLIEQLRKVPMLKDPTAFPYANAMISLVKIRTEFLSPPQNYVWIKELQKLQKIRWGLCAQGIDIFNLDGYINYRSDFDGEVSIFDMCPPVIEESIEQDGSVHLIINDGMHRLWLARAERVIPQVVYIRGISSRYPYYAFPRVEGWSGVDVLSENPGKDYVKKYHRIQDNKRLYRDFAAVFSNVGRSRSGF